MTAPEPTPTDEHTDAVARAVCASEFATGFGASEWDETITNRDWYRDNARAILTSTDAAVHAALLAALVRAGVLTEECAPIYRGAEHHHWQQRWDGQHTHEGRRFVTPWEVAP